MPRRCGCAQDCLCSLINGNCTTVTGSGSASSPFKVNVEINPDLTNKIQCTVLGLLVPDGGVSTLDTNCIAITGDGSVALPLSATPILDANVCNLLSCGVNGLVALAFTTDTNCILLSGCGTNGDPFVADLRISAAPGNVALCTPLGLYVPAVAAGAIQYEGEIYLTATQTIPGAVGATSGIVLFDLVINDLGAVTDIANNRFLIPVGGAGWYVIHGAIGAQSAEYGLSGASANGYQQQLAILINGSPGLSKGWVNEAVMNKSLLVSSRLTQVLDGGTYLNAGDTVELEYTFKDLSGGAVGNQLIDATSMLKIIQVGV